MASKNDYSHVSASQSGHRHSQTKRYDAGCIARIAIFITLLAVGTIPIAFSLGAGITPILLWLVLYMLLGLVALSLRVPSHKPHEVIEDTCAGEHKTAQG